MNNGATPSQRTSNPQQQQQQQQQQPQPNPGQSVVSKNLEALLSQHLTSILHDAVRLQRKCKRQKLSTVDLHLALRSRYPHPQISGMSLIPSFAGAKHSSSSRSVDLNSYLQSDVSMNCPNEPGLAVHWLSVDGVQPMIPMNVASTTLAQNRDDQDGNREDIEVKQLLPHLLSEELQMYFRKVTMSIEEFQQQGNISLGQLKLSLNSVRNDIGIQELVPFFIKFVVNQIYQSLDEVEHLRILLRLADALICNPSLHLELHLHQLFPAIITCVIAGRLGRDSSDDHWSLRIEAASILFHACKSYSEYTSLKSRIMKTYVEAMSPNRTLASQFGGIVGITSFGEKAIEAFIVLVATELWIKWEQLLENLSSTSEKGYEIMQCETALLNALGVFMHNQQDQTLNSNSSDFMDIFCEKLVPYNKFDISQYSECIL